jgi:transcriptional regulator with XRE-family HTH domain
MTILEICKFLKQERIRKKIRAIDLCFQTGVNYHLIYYYESGKRFPRSATLEAWANGLGYQLTLEAKTEGN